MKLVILFIFALFLLIGCVQLPEKGSSFSNEEVGVTEEKKVEFVCDPTPKERMFETEKYYEGSLIDAHLHMPVLLVLPDQVRKILPWDNVPVLGKDVTSEQIVCVFEQNKIKKAIGFYSLLKALVKPSVSEIKNVEEKHPGKIEAFLLPAPLSAPTFSPETLDEIYTTHPGVFRGYGELATYFEVFFGTSPDDELFMGIYDVAGKHNKIVMVHPTKINIDEMENAIKQNEDVIFLLHGGEGEDQISGVLSRNKNVYYSVDASITEIFDFDSSKEYSVWLEKNFDDNLKKQLEIWKPIIEENPDQMMWGTDRLMDWHFDEEGSALIVEFGRAFIGQLDPAVQEKFAYKNAERMLEK